MDLTALTKQINYKWRVQSFSKNKPSCSCVAYIDARDVMNLLDSACGPQNWQSDFKEVAGHVVAGVGIKINDEWVWKWDTGAESNTEKEKGLFSDSFKRAAVKWGIGRFLYDLDIVYLNTNEKNTGSNYPYPVKEDGSRIYEISEYINSLCSKCHSQSKFHKPYCPNGSSQV